MGLGDQELLPGLPPTGAVPGRCWRCAGSSRRCWPPPGSPGRPAHPGCGGGPRSGSPPRVVAPGHGPACRPVAGRAAHAGTSTAGRQAPEASATGSLGSRRTPTSVDGAAAATTPPTPTGQPVEAWVGSPGGVAPPPDAGARGSPHPWPHRRGRAGSTSAEPGAVAGIPTRRSCPPSCRARRRWACAEPQAIRRDPIFEPHRFLRILGQDLGNGFSASSGYRCGRSSSALAATASPLPGKPSARSTPGPNRTRRSLAPSRFRRSARIGRRGRCGSARRSRIRPGRLRMRIAQLRAVVTVHHTAAVEAKNLD